MHPRRAQCADDHKQRRSHQIGQPSGFFLAALGEVFGEGGDKGARESALREEIAGQIGNSETQQEGVVD